MSIGISPGRQNSDQATIAILLAINKVFAMRTFEIQRAFFFEELYYTSIDASKPIIEKYLHAGC